MSYLVATLLLYMDEFEAFRCLANLLSRRLSMEFYCLRKEAIDSYVMCFNHYFKKLLPLLFKHMNSEGVTSEMFLMDWYLSLFTKALPLELATHIWDIYLLEGELYLMCVGLGILKLYAARLSTFSFERVTPFLLHLPESINPDDLFYCIAQIQISRKSYENTRRKMMLKCFGPGYAPYVDMVVDPTSVELDDHHHNHHYQHNNHSTPMRSNSSLQQHRTPLSTTFTSSKNSLNAAAGKLLDRTHHRTSGSSGGGNSRQNSISDTKTVSGTVETSTHTGSPDSYGERNSGDQEHGSSRGSISKSGSVSFNRALRASLRVTRKSFRGARDSIFGTSSSSKNRDTGSGDGRDSLFRGSNGSNRNKSRDNASQPAGVSSMAAK